MPIRLCMDCGMQQAKYRGRCQPCSRQREQATHPNKSIYNSRRWKYLRRKQLHHHPMCAHCLNDGYETLATDVDHIVPIEQGGDAWAQTNLQSLCAVCHGRKTRREQSTTKGVTR